MGGKKKSRGNEAERGGEKQEGRERKRQKQWDGGLSGMEQCISAHQLGVWFSKSYLDLWYNKM